MCTLLLFGRNYFLLIKTSVLRLFEFVFAFMSLIFFFPSCGQGVNDNHSDTPF